jgi:predicted dehydrogenase
MYWLSYVYILTILTSDASALRLMSMSSSPSSSSSKKLTWAIIGAGNVCEIKAAPVAFRQAAEEGCCDVRCIVRRSEARAQNFVTRHDIAHYYSDVDAMLAGEEGVVNAVYISTPPSSHFGYAMRSLEAGIKHLYVEKPVTLNASDATLLAAAVEKHGAKLVVAHYRNSLPLYKYIKSLLVDQKVIGDVRTVSIRVWKAISPPSPSSDINDNNSDNWRLDPSISGGGYFHDLSPHALALMRFMFGPAELGSVHGRALSQATEGGVHDQVSGTYLFSSPDSDRDNSNSKVVSLNASWCFTVAPGEEVDECVVVGSKGCIKFPFFSGSSVSVSIGGIPNTDHSKEFTHPEHIQSSMIQEMTAYFLGETERNPCSIEDAIEVMTIIDSFTA